MNNIKQNLICKVNILHISLTILFLCYELGYACEYDADCITEHSYCRNQQVCECKRGFVPSPEDNEQCIATVGAICHSRFDCSSLENSDCRQGVCECARGYITEARMENCIPVVTDYNGYCEQDNQCQETFGQQSHCFNDHCRCLPSYHFADGRCFKNTGLFKQCQNKSLCWIGDEWANMVDCLNGQCLCRDGYFVTEDNKCLYPSRSWKLGSPLLLLFIELLCTISYS